MAFIAGLHGLAAPSRCVSRDMTRIEVLVVMVIAVVAEGGAGPAEHPHSIQGGTLGQKSKTEKSLKDC